MMTILNFFPANGTVLDHHVWNQCHCGSRLIYELLPGEEILYYVIPITAILGKLPTVRAGDTEDTPYRYRGTNRFDRNIARADSAPGSGGRVICESREFAQKSTVLIALNLV